MNQDINNLIKLTRNSSFNRNSYNVTIPFHRFISSIELHSNYDKSTEYKTEDSSTHTKPEDFIKHITPEFQRSNDKWSKDMKVKFVENVLNGADTVLKLFTLEENKDSKLIDGLQRTTAICDFINGDIKPFGYSYSDLKDSLRKFNTHISTEIYTFDNWEEVGKFYIDMNENITHSKEDIQKAKDYFLKEKGIKL